VLENGVKVETSMWQNRASMKRQVTLHQWSS